MRRVRSSGEVREPGGRVIAKKRINAIVGAIEKIEKLDDFRTLTRLLE